MNNPITATMRQLDQKRGAVHIEDVYDTDIDDLWSAATDPVRLSRWIATVEGDLRVGGTFHARFTSAGEGPGRIEVCNAPHHLVVTMQPGSEDESVIEATLTADGDRTRLVVEDRGLPLNVLHLHGAGWHAHLEDLARYLAGTESAWKSRWEELTPEYESLKVQ